MGSPWIRRLSDRPEYFPTRVRRSDNSPRPIKIAAPLLPWVEPKGDLKLSRRGHSGPRRGVCAMRTPDLGPNPWQTLRHGLPANAVGRALGPIINSEGSNPAWLGLGNPPLQSRNCHLPLYALRPLFHPIARNAAAVAGSAKSASPLLMCNCRVGW